MFVQRLVRGMAVLVAFGCDFPTGSPRTWQLVAPAAAAEAPPCSNSMGSSVRRCRIDVVVTPKDSASCEATIPDAQQRELQLGAQRKLRIIWRLNAGNGTYVFCRYTGDGSFLKSPVRVADNQVSRFRVLRNPDDDDPSMDANTEHGCHTRFKWTFENDSGGGFPTGTQYDYLVRVRSNDFQRTCVLDPWVRNGSGALAPPKTAR